LVIVFAIRLAKTRKFMPAGLMAILGLVTLGVMVNQLVGLSKRDRSVSYEQKSDRSNHKVPLVINY
jgi:hypothetical protein